MYKGEISNKFAPTVVIDINLIFTQDKESLVNKALNLLGIRKYKVIDKRIHRYLERLFYKDYTIYLVDRNTNYDIPEKLFDTWCYSEYLKIIDIEDMEMLIEQTKVVLAVFDKDYPALQVGKGKAYNFLSWGDLVSRLI